MSLIRHIRQTTGIALTATLLLASGVALAKDAPVIALTRLDCGNSPAPTSVATFSDTYTHENLKLQLTYSCYLVRHGDDYLLWDAGQPANGAPQAPKKPLVELLAELKLTPSQVRYVGISHHHGDHTGQAAAFPAATLLIGKGDWDMLSASTPPAGMTAEDFNKRRAPLTPWYAQGAKVEALTADKKDVFGDGSVVMLNLPGHTPGHHGLLVRLKSRNVLLSGDATHFHENYAIDGVPTWNSNRADTLASLDRFKKIAKALKATVIIQHDPRDIGKLPAFPQAAQ